MNNRRYSTDNVLLASEMRNERILILIISILAPLCIGTGIIFFLQESGAIRIVTGAGSLLVCYFMYYVLFGDWYKFFSKEETGGGGFVTIPPGSVGVVLKSGTRTGWIVEEGLVLLHAPEQLEFIETQSRTLRVVDVAFTCKDSRRIKMSFDLGVRLSNPYKFLANLKGVEDADERMQNAILGVIALSLAEITAEEATKKPDSITEAVIKTLSQNDYFGIEGEAEVEEACHWIESFKVAGAVAFENKDNQIAIDAEEMQSAILKIAMTGKSADHLPTSEEIAEARQFVLAQMGKASVVYTNISGLESGGTLILGSGNQSYLAGGNKNRSNDDSTKAKKKK